MSLNMSPQIYLLSLVLWEFKYFFLMRWPMSILTLFFTKSHSPPLGLHVPEGVEAVHKHHSHSWFHLSWWISSKELKTQRTHSISVMFLKPCGNNWAVNPRVSTLHQLKWNELNWCKRGDSENEPAGCNWVHAHGQYSCLRWGEERAPTPSSSFQ